jgi:monoamine oxidase
MGSWTTARPGGAPARETLTEKPIHIRIYLAGEPFSRQKYGTAHGAFISGTAAANAIVAKRQR